MGKAEMENWLMKDGNGVNDKWVNWKWLPLAHLFGTKDIDLFFFFALIQFLDTKGAEVFFTFLCKT